MLRPYIVYAFLLNSFVDLDKGEASRKIIFIAESGSNGCFAPTWGILFAQELQWIDPNGIENY
jgi:hypothetical protein